MSSFTSGSNRSYLYLLGLPLILALTCIADISFPLGTAVWVIYLLPTVIAFASPYRLLPVAAAALSVVCMAIGFYNAPTGVDPALALVNRSLATIVNMLLAGIGMMFISYRLDARRQQWMREAEAELTRRTGGEQTPEEIGLNTLGFIVERFGAAAGLVYVRDGEEYRRVASTGVPASVSTPDRIGRNDGLLGDTIRRGGTLIVDDVPDGYLAFGSGLGSAKPRSLVIGTGRVDEMVNTVVEIGFLEQPGANPKDLPEFFELVSGHLGTAIRSGKYRARLQNLLAETQQQAEELQAQSEELRATNDELWRYAKVCRVADVMRPYMESVE